MTEAFPPPVLSDAAIGAVLARRIDLQELSRGMVVGVTEAEGHHFIAHGYMDRSAAYPVDADTLFEIGSITKLFTALVLADMVRCGEASLDEPVAELLPDGVSVPARNGRSITLLDLARHRAGLPRMPANFGLAEQTDPDKPDTAEMLYSFLAEHRLARTPGDIEVYSNLGYGLLGYALALRASTPYEILVRSRVLAPLRMRGTTISVPPEAALRLAIGHDDALEPVPAWRFGLMASAGALRSSAADMLFFADSLRCPTQTPLVDLIAILTRPAEAGGHRSRNASSR